MVWSALLALPDSWTFLITHHEGWIPIITLGTSKKDDKMNPIAGCIPKVDGITSWWSFERDLQRRDLCGRGNCKILRILCRKRIY